MTYERRRERGSDDDYSDGDGPEEREYDYDGHQVDYEQAEADYAVEFSGGGKDYSGIFDEDWSMVWWVEGGRLWASP